MSVANKLGMHTDDLPLSVSEGAFPKMCQVFVENLTCSSSHLPKANFAWLEFNDRRCAK